MIQTSSHSKTCRLFNFTMVKCSFVCFVHLELKDAVSRVNLPQQQTETLSRKLLKAVDCSTELRSSLKHFSGLVFIFKIQYPTLFLEQVDFTCTFLFAYIFQDLLHLTEYDLLVLGVHNHLHRLHLLTSLRLLQERERRRGTLALQHAAGCLNTFYLT